MSIRVCKHSKIRTILSINMHMYNSVCIESLLMQHLLFYLFSFLYFSNFKALPFIRIKKFITIKSDHSNPFFISFSFSRFFASQHQELFLYWIALVEGYKWNFKNSSRTSCISIRLMRPMGAIEKLMSLIPDLGQILNFYGGIEEFFRWIDGCWRLKESCNFVHVACLAYQKTVNTSLSITVYLRPIL